MKSQGYFSSLTSKKLLIAKQALRFFEFGKDLQRWIEVFYKDISSCVINNGHASPFFSICRGVRQGCPLSPYLFIICIELLAIQIRNDPAVKGIAIFKSRKNQRSKNIFICRRYHSASILPGTEETLHAQCACCFSEISHALICSGIKLDFSKWKVLKTGSLKNSNVVFCKDSNLK